MAEQQSYLEGRQFENYGAYNDLTYKATDVKRIVPDEYFRVKKGYNNTKDYTEYCSVPDKRTKLPKRSKSASQRPKLIQSGIKHDWLDKRELSLLNKQIMNGKIKNFDEFVKKLDINLPNSTLYTIDKAVRDRLRKGRYGKDFSEYINVESEEEHKVAYYHHEMLRLGDNSIRIPYIPHSILLKDKLLKSPILPQNKPKNGPSEYKSIRRPKTGQRAKSVGKYGSWRNGKGTHKEQYSDWRMRKIAEDRLKARLVEEAKQEIRDQILSEIHKIRSKLKFSNQESEEGEQNDSQKSHHNSALAFTKEEISHKERASYINFQDFCLKTKGVYYPNPLF